MEYQPQTPSLALDRLLQSIGLHQSSGCSEAEAGTDVPSRFVVTTSDILQENVATSVDIPVSSDPTVSASEDLVSTNTMVDFQAMPAGLCGILFSDHPDFRCMLIGFLFQPSSEGVV
jgi:hypothetical protein